MPQLLEKLRLERDLATGSAVFRLTLAGNFCGYTYKRINLVVASITRVQGPGEPSPLLVELLWDLRGPASELVARGDLQPEGEGMDDGLIRTLAERGETVSLKGPRGASGYEFHTTVRSLGSLRQLLEVWPARFAEFFVLYFVRSDKLPEFSSRLSERAFTHRRADLIKPFMDFVEVIVADESDKERNLLALYGPQRNEGRVIALVRQMCDRFGVRLEGLLG